MTDPNGQPLNPEWYDVPAPLKGVHQHDYSDLDSYGQFHNYSDNIDRPALVMTNGQYAVRPNDIEMMILAYQTGQRQNYQTQFWGDSVSKALGRGN